MTSRGSKMNSKKTQESLDSRAQKIDSQNDEMQREIQELTAEIKQLGVKLKTTKDTRQRDRIKAQIKQKLDQKKRLERRIEQRRSMSLNLGHASNHLQNAQDTKDTVKAMKSGTKALKKRNKSLSRSEVEDVREECDDLVQQSETIQDILSRPLHSQHQADDDDEQLDEELACIMAEPDEEAPLNGNEEMLLSDTSPDVFDPRPSPGCDQNKPEDGLNGDNNAGGDKKGRDGDRDLDIPGVGLIPIPFVVPILAALPPVLPVPLLPMPGVPPIVKNPFGKKGSSDDKPSKKNEGKEDKKQEKKKKDEKNECKEEKKNECEEEGDKDCKEEHEDRDPERPDLSEKSSSEEEEEGDKTGEQKTKKKRTLIGRAKHRVKKRLGLAKKHNSGTADPVGTEGRTDGVLITDGFQVPAMFSPTGKSDLPPNSSSEAGGLKQPMVYKPPTRHTSLSSTAADQNRNSPSESRGHNPGLMQSNQPKPTAPPVPKPYRRDSSESPIAHNTRFSGQPTGSGMPPPTSGSPYMDIPPPTSGSAYMGIPPPTSGSAYMVMPPPTSESVSTPPSKFKPKRSAPPVPSGENKTEVAARRNSGHGLRRQSIGSNTPPSRSGSVHMPSSVTKPQPPRPYTSRQESSPRNSNNDTDSFVDPDLNALEPQWALSESDDRQSNINCKSEQCNTNEGSGSSTSPSSIRSLEFSGSELNSSELHHDQWAQGPAVDQSDTKIEQCSRSEMSGPSAISSIRVSKACSLL